ncbi:MAG: hypothetical protein H0T42_24105 [Deltaproteobacteria bacterium]|nr:hypothetical protein [Deltaproteobacteria bacterium]
MSTRALALAILTIAACVEAPTSEEPGAGCTGKCDGNEASPATLRNRLLANLIGQRETGAVLFGQQRFNVTGVDGNGAQWLATAGHVDRSDARDVVGQHPAVFGFDAWDLAIKPASWAPTPAVHSEAAKYTFARGGVVTMDFHQRGCAVDSFSAAGNEACLCKIANDDAFARSWIGTGYAKVADALEQHGLDRLPIVVRPLHEHTGNWFWWGKPYWNCAAYLANPRVTGQAAYQRVFRTVVDYLRDERGLDNLLFAYSPDQLGETNLEQAYLEGYPGDAYVDVLGIDLYYRGAPSFAAETSRFQRYLGAITKLASERGKAAALTEVGNTLTAAETTATTWFSEQLAGLLRDSGLAYAMTWENRTAESTGFFLPFPGHPSTGDLRTFVESPLIHLLGDASGLYAPTRAAYPVCEVCPAQPVEERWGWENERSCRLGSWCL